MWGVLRVHPRSARVASLAALPEPAAGRLRVSLLGIPLVALLLGAVLAVQWRRRRTSAAGPSSDRDHEG